jgi:hypothetical protein
MKKFKLSTSISHPSMENSVAFYDQINSSKGNSDPKTTTLPFFGRLKEMRPSFPEGLSQSFRPDKF